MTLCRKKLLSALPFDIFVVDVGGGDLGPLRRTKRDDQGRFVQQYFQAMIKES